jgi:catechol 2,3-dioxygenase-like lactoylglutathione lyase family enzyme
MKMKSISGILCFVKDLGKTADFYKALGFEFKDRTSEYMTAFLNEFWIEFVQEDKAEKSVFKKEVEIDKTNNGAGLFLHIDVENVDEFYKNLLGKGLKPVSEPKDFPWGRREFVIRDPDDYKLVLFQNR